jgi:radical SAM-linked protein
MAFLESVLARGDRKLAACILAAWKSGGHFDGWDEHFDLGRWRAAAESCDIRLETYAEAISFSQPLPWSEISTGVSQTFLRLERDKADKGEITTDCRDGTCTGCGVCKDAACRATQQVFAPSSTESVPPLRQPSQQAAERHTYRLIYKKDSSIRFLGHLDMMNVLLRALRTARIPLAFSAGCRPHPLVSFGPPLSLGIAARAELLDVTINGLLGEAVAEINRCLPPGLAVLDAKELPAGGVSLNENIRAGHYLFEPCAGSVSLDVFSDIIASFITMDKVEVDVTKNGATRKKDIRPLVYSLALCEAPANSFEAVLSMESGNTCKAFELLAALFPGQSSWNFLVTRLECLRIETGKTSPVWK